jgi:endonuclease/exonuclease/phosphatase family metal-dependent hydrolase
MGNLKITAMSFNLRVHKWSDLHHAWPFRRDGAAEAVRAQKPWILGTQEGKSSMLRDLDLHLKEYGRVGKGRSAGGGGEHNAVFYLKSKLQLLDWGQFWLSETPERPGSTGWDGRFPRICTWARFRLQQDPQQELRVYNTHLDHMGETARLEGASLIWSFIREQQSELGSAPVILCGDFNTGPTHPAIRFLSGEAEWNGQRSGLANAFADPGHAGRTFHGFQGGKSGAPIDFVFGGFGLQPLHGDVNRSKYRGRYPSDHYPVTGVFRLKQRTERTLSRSFSRRIPGPGSGRP